MITSKLQAPPVGGMGGFIHSWERTADPWHRDAFKGTGLTDADLDNALVISLEGPIRGGVRAEGWGGLDWCGNLICFVPDGTEVQA
jgi:hypothetical protein